MVLFPRAAWHRFAGPARRRRCLGFTQGIAPGGAAATAGGVPPGVVSLVRHSQFNRAGSIPVLSCLQCLLVSVIYFVNLRGRHPEAYLVS